MPLSQTENRARGSPPRPPGEMGGTGVAINCKVRLTRGVKMSWHEYEKTLECNDDDAPPVTALNTMPSMTALNTIRPAMPLDADLAAVAHLEDAVTDDAAAAGELCGGLRRAMEGFAEPEPSCGLPALGAEEHGAKGGGAAPVPGTLCRHCGAQPRSPGLPHCSAECAHADPACRACGGAKIFTEEGGHYYCSRECALRDPWNFAHAR